jgi:hypothetical protein
VIESERRASISRAKSRAAKTIRRLNRRLVQAIQIRASKFVITITSKRDFIQILFSIWFL